MVQKFKMTFFDKLIYKGFIDSGLPPSSDFEKSIADGHASGCLLFG